MHGGRPTVVKKHNPLFKNMIKCADCGGVVTWQKQKGRYYGACQRLGDECKGAKYVREDKLEADIAKMLGELVCPSPEVIEWVSNEMRGNFEQSVAIQNKAAESIKSQIVKLKRMDEVLYDDKLSGEISAVKYREKHDEFTKRIAELELELCNVDSNAAGRMEQRLVALELTQKALEIFPRRTVEQRRLIVGRLFKEMVYSKGVVIVEFTSFASVIAKNVQLTKKIIGV
jgi:hypothetical protein